MKKSLALVLASILLPALTPALGGDLTGMGTYRLEGFSYRQSERSSVSGLPASQSGSDAWYQNDFQLYLNLSVGSVSATTDFEVVDSGRGQLAGASRVRANAAGGDLVNTYLVSWKATEDLTLKTGQYSLNWGKNLGFYQAGGYNIGVAWSLDPVELGLTIGKLDEGIWNGGGTVSSKDADKDQYILTAEFGGFGPFSKLGLVFLDQHQEKANVYTYWWSTIPLQKTTDATFTGAELALSAGPVALSLEGGIYGGEVPAMWPTRVAKVKGNYLFLGAGLDDLVGFDLSVNLFRSSKDMYQGFGELFEPLLILGNDNLDLWDRITLSAIPAPPAGNGAHTLNQNLTLAWVAGSYPVTDRLTLGGAIGAARFTDKDFYGMKKGAIGTEIDATAAYKVAENASLTGAYGYLVPNKDNFALPSGEAPKTSLLYSRLTFHF